MQTDEQLMLALRAAGDDAREAFTELFARYRRPVWGFFRRRLGDPARAEELAQETFLAVLRGAARWEPRASFRSYLYGIALNLVAAERRRNSHRDLAAVAAEPAAAPGSDATEAALAVRQALTRLDADHREVLLLREFEELGYEDIAGLLGLPVGTVRSRLFRARMALAAVLAPRASAPPAKSAAQPASETGKERPRKEEQ